MRPQGFPARLRLKQRREFLRVQRGGRKIHLRHFLVFVVPRRADKGKAAGGSDSSKASSQRSKAKADIELTRCGITVTRKVGDAVRRNRIKRLVRDVFRRNREQLPTGLDLVWVAKQQAAGLDHAAVTQDFELLCRELARGDRRPPRRDGGRPGGAKPGASKGTPGKSSSSSSSKRGKPGKPGKPSGGKSESGAGGR